MQPISKNIGTAELKELIDLALPGLVPMFDPDENLFCHRLNQTQHGLVREGISHRYTIMTLLGLHVSSLAGFESTIDCDAALRRLSNKLDWIDNGGDFGLYLWLCSVVRPELLARAATGLGKDVHERWPDLAAGRTMELAWLLAGISHMQLAGFDAIPDLGELANRTYLRLNANQGDRGVFGHQAQRGLLGRVRGRIGTFADQVYPIYALSKFGVAFGVQEALHAAKECADTICHHQGSLGQWWWRYDSVGGGIASKYPVYSVHQHGMGGMALNAVSEATGENYLEPILSALPWVAGENELHFDLRDSSLKIIWRSFFQNRPKAFLNVLRALGGQKPIDGGLQIKRECRPYELGWLLYALVPVYDRLMNQGKLRRNAGQSDMYVTSDLQVK